MPCFRPPMALSYRKPAVWTVLDVRRLAMLASMVAVAASLSGCALATATPPTVDVLDVHLTGIGLTEQQLAVTLCVTNPSASELAFRRVLVDLNVSGLPLAAGASDLAVRLSPSASTVVPFTVATTVRNLGPQLLEVFRTGAVDYRVHGTVTLQGSFALTLPYSRSGHLDPLTTGLNFAAGAADPTPSRCQATKPTSPTSWTSILAVSLQSRSWSS